jgi:hypothetical protein
VLNLPWYVQVYESIPLTSLFLYCIICSSESCRCVEMLDSNRVHPIILGLHKNPPYYEPLTLFVFSCMDGILHNCEQKTSAMEWAKTMWIFRFYKLHTLRHSLYDPVVQWYTIHPSIGNSLWLLSCGWTMTKLPRLVYPLVSSSLVSKPTYFHLTLPR